MRRFLAALSTVGLCLTLSACWDAEAAEQTDFWAEEPPPVEEPVQESAKAASFTLPYLNSQTLDPIACSDGVQQVVGSLLYEGLFELDARFEAQNVLCASYSVSDNGLVYTFTLRGDAAFSNGSALSPSDVLAAYRRAQASERYSARFANIASMRTGRGTFIVTLHEADSALPALLDIPIVKSGTEKDPVPVGTGPYLFLTDSEGACLVRNENWWRDAAGGPERIALAPAKDADTAVYLFSAEKAHLIVADLLGDTSAVSLGGVERTDAPTATMLFLGFNSKNKALSDAALRAAMGHALDRDSVVSALLAGHAMAAQFPISPASALYPTMLDAAFEPGTYEALLTPQGAEDSPVQVELRLLVNAENSFKTALAEYLARQLTAAHITVTPVILPWSDYLAALEGGDFDLWLGELRLTADWNIRDLVGTGGALNYGKFSDAALDKAIGAFLANENTITAAALCTQLAALSPIQPIVFKSLSVLTPEKLIDGVSPTATHPMAGLSRWAFHFPAAAAQNK